MKPFKINCVVTVMAESLEDAISELHDEANYLLGLDNNLVALETDNEGADCEIV